MYAVALKPDGKDEIISVQKRCTDIYKCLTPVTDPQNSDLLLRPVN